MPIKGLTDNAQWPRLGVLRKGAEKMDEKRPGTDLKNQLRFVGQDRSIDQDWREVFGGLLVSEISVRMPYPSIDQNWQAWREHWLTGGLVYRCDGEEHVRWYDKASGTYRDDPVPCPGERCLAKPVGRLELIVPDFQRLGTVTLQTTSLHDIKNIDGCVRALALAVGDLSLVPLTLKRVPRKIPTPGEDGKRVRREKWLLHLEAAPDWVRYALMPSTEEPPALADNGPDALPMLDDDSPEIEVSEPVPASGWTERIDGCQTVEDLEALIPELGNIAELRYRENVERLLYGRIVNVIVGVVDRLNLDQLKRAEAKLSALPEKTEGLSVALDRVHGRQDQLSTPQSIPTNRRMAGAVA